MNIGVCHALISASMAIRMTHKVEMGEAINQAFILINKYGHQQVRWRSSLRRDKEKAA